MTLLSLKAGLNAPLRQSWGWAVADRDGSQVHLDLEAGALWKARGDQHWRVIICRRGLVWITQERDVADYVLREGEIFIVTLPGMVLVEAIKPAKVTIVTPSIRARPYAGDYRPFR